MAELYKSRLYESGLDEVGDIIDDIGGKVGDAINGEDVQGALDAAGDKVQEGVEYAKDKIQEWEQEFHVAQGVIPLGLVVLTVILLRRPIKWVLKLVVNCVAGLALLLLLHAFGEQLQIMLELNTANVVISAVFGVPGVAVLFLIQWLSLR